MGTDLNASASASSSSTSGNKTSQQVSYGDVITGGGRKQQPTWLWLALGGFVLVAAALFIVRR